MTSASATVPSPSDGQTPTETSSHTYALRSELAQFCLPSSTRDVNRKFAYVNSICVAFLIVGVVGLRIPKFVQRPLPEIVEYFPVEFTPPPDEPTVEPEPNPDDTEAPPPDPMQDVTPVLATVVAANAADVTFAIPVEGPVILAPAKYAAPPPLVLPKAQSAPKPTVMRFVASEAKKGNYPKPPYIPNTLPPGSVAAIEFLVAVNGDGSVSKVEILKSSGSIELDRKTQQFIRFRWQFEALGIPREYSVPIEFQVTK